MVTEASRFPKHRVRSMYDETTTIRTELDVAIHKIIQEHRSSHRSTFSFSLGGGLKREGTRFYQGMPLQEVRICCSTRRTIFIRLIAHSEVIDIFGEFPIRVSLMVCPESFEPHLDRGFRKINFRWSIMIYDEINNCSPIVTSIFERKFLSFCPLVGWKVSINSVNSSV